MTKTSQYGNQYGKFSKELEVDLQYDPAVPLLGIYPKDSVSSCRDTCSPMFIAALFIIVRK